MTARFHSTFASLAHSPNYRRYFVGQGVSLAGTWMQTIAQGWLVLRLTGSGTAVGLVTAFQFIPVLLLGPLGGVVVDRMDTRRLLVITQAIAGALALTLGILTIANVVELWMVYVLAAGLGAVTVVDNPARQTFVLELVGPELLTNAVTLNSVNINAARVVGPAVAAGLIAAIGIGPCFIVNAASYAAVIVALVGMNASALAPKTIAPRAKGQVREGLRYVWATPALRTPLVMMGIIGTLTYEFQVALPIFARFTFEGSAGTYGVLTAAMGLGAVVGGLVTASRSRSGLDALVRVAAVFGVVVLATAASPTLPVAVGGLVAVGAASITFLARANTTMQLGADPVMRGRVMALWTVAFLGTTPIGGPIIGFIGEQLGPRWALTVGGSAALAAAGFGWLAGHLGDRRASASMTAPPPSLAPSAGH